MYLILARVVLTWMAAGWGLVMLVLATCGIVTWQFSILKWPQSNHGMLVDQCHTSWRSRWPPGLVWLSCPSSRRMGGSSYRQSRRNATVRSWMVHQQGRHSWGRQTLSCGEHEQWHFQSCAVIREDVRHYLAGSTNNDTSKATQHSWGRDTLSCGEHEQWHFQSYPAFVRTWDIILRGTRTMTLPKLPSIREDVRHYLAGNTNNDTSKATQHSWGRETLSCGEHEQWHFQSCAVIREDVRHYLAGSTNNDTFKATQTSQRRNICRPTANQPSPPHTSHPPRNPMSTRHKYHIIYPNP